MRRINRVVLVGGSLPEKLLHQGLPYEDPRIQALAKQFQGLLNTLTGSVAGGPVDLQDYCDRWKTPEAFHPQYRLVATQVLTAIIVFARWETLSQQLLETQRKRDGITHTALLGHSFGLWLAAFVAGLYDQETAIRLVIARATSAWREGIQSVVITRAKDDPEIPLSVIQGICEITKYAWVSVVNHGKQILVSGTESSVARVQAALNDLLIEARPYTNFAAWHTPLLADAQEELARKFSSLPESNKLQIPIFFLDSRGRLRATKDPARIITQMLEELAKPFDFEARARQLPDGIEVYEISTRPYVERILTEVRASYVKQPSPASTPTQRRKALLAHPS